MVRNISEHILKQSVRAISMDSRDFFKNITSRKNINKWKRHLDRMEKNLTMSLKSQVFCLGSTVILWELK